MMDAVEEHEIPQHRADGHRLIVEEWDRAVEIFGSELGQSRRGIAVDARECGRELLDGPRAGQSFRPRVAREAAALDGEGSESLRLREVPGQLAQRTAI